MGHIAINDLHKEYIDRRRKRRRKEDNIGQTNQITQVLDNINLEFQEGEMVALLGPSGCGKSTLLRLVAGFEKPTSGRILIDGAEVMDSSSDHIFVFQHNALLPWMTVWQNIELGLRFMEDEEIMKEKIQEHIEMVELSGFEHHYPHQLSGGMMRRAELARALVVDPEVLFMDEPFSGLDFLTHMKMREEVVNMHAYFGKTIVFVTHDINDAVIMANRVVVLSGRPARVKLIQKLDFPRPRNYEKMPKLSKFRDEVFFMLGVHYAV